MNLYASLAEVKATMNQMSNTDNDAVLLSFIEAASRGIDDWTGRIFYVLNATRDYTPPVGERAWWLPDELISITSLGADSDADGTFELALTAADDYRLYPLNETPKMRLDLRLDAVNLASFPSSEGGLRLAGKFGYAETLEDTGVELGAGVLAAATSFTLSGVLAKVSPGTTYLIDDEQVYHEAGTSSPITVVRGVNGTTAAAHDADATLYRYRYPAQIRQATIMQSLKQFTRRESNYANVVASTEVGTYAIYRGLDPDVIAALDPFRRLPRIA